MADENRPEPAGSDQPGGAAPGEPAEAQHAWFHQEQVMMGAPSVPTASELSDEQVARIKKAKRILKEHQTERPEAAMARFRRQAYPETGIRVLEHVAARYEAELAARPGATKRDRRLLYAALSRCAMAQSPEQVLAATPRLVSLRGVREVCQRFFDSRPTEEGM